MNEVANQYLGTITPISSQPLSTIKEQWSRLELSADADFSLSWSWMESWLKLVDGATNIYLFTCTINDDPVAMCFLTLSKAKRLKGRLTVTQLQLNEFLQDGLNMVVAYNGLLGPRQHMEPAWACFVSTAESWSSAWDEIAVSSLRRSQCQRLAKIQAGTTIKLEKMFRCWCLDLNPGASSLDDLIDGFKRKSRQQLRQTRKAYSALGELSIQAAETVHEALSFFQKMGELHTLRWQRVGNAGSFSNPSWVSFHTDLIRRCFDRGYVQLLRVSCSGQAIGYLYGHVYGGTVYMHQTGFVESEDNRVRPGYISHCLAMLHNIEQGNYRYDFLPDEQESYKKFFMEEGAPVFWVLVQRPRLKFLVERAMRQLRRGSKMESVAIPEVL